MTCQRVQRVAVDMHQLAVDGIGRAGAAAGVRMVAADEVFQPGGQCPYREMVGDVRLEENMAIHPHP